MKLLSQIGTHAPDAPSARVRIRRAARRVKWQYVFWVLLLAVT